MPSGAEFPPIVKQQAQKWRVDGAGEAIIQNESSPMARSHSAFGLMRIVPASAGRRRHPQSRGKEKSSPAPRLFRPETNIELGAPMNILDTQPGAVNPRAGCTRDCRLQHRRELARSFTGNIARCPAH